MKAVVTGETRQLSPSERRELEKLAIKRSRPDQLIDGDLARRSAQLSTKLNALIGLLIGRDGRVTHLVLGTRERLYLPDLGRFRLDQARLRRLRLVVFSPDDRNLLWDQLREEVVVRGVGDATQSSGSGGSRKRSVLSPMIAPDLLTDLEKLRLDVLAVVAADEEGEPGAVSLAHLEPGEEKAATKTDALRERSIRFLRARALGELRVDFQDLIGDLEERFSASAERGFQTGLERAVLVGAYTSDLASAEEHMAELRELARTAGLEVVDSLVQRRRKLDPKTVIGKGKVEELMLQCLDLGVDLIIFDRELSPGQLRSITNITELKVLDRSMLILDIFAQRAVTSEGRLQVELAQLKYSLPRLSEQDMGLSRLTGGIGGRGPGETKLEISRRRTRQRISLLEKKIAAVSSQRAVRRQRRQHRGVPAVAIVGYTNAGKSTLLNQLTKAKVLVENKLFATLDTTSRRMRFPNEKEVIFVDTVGFIRELPKELLNAFKATLEEVGEADVLIHLADATNTRLLEQVATVNKTLESLGYGDKPIVLVLNKCDRLSAVELSALKNTLGGVPISALKRAGFEPLIAELQERLSASFAGQDPGQFIPLS